MIFVLKLTWDFVEYFQNAKRGYFLGDYSRASRCSSWANERLLFPQSSANLCHEIGLPLQSPCGRLHPDFCGLQWSRWRYKSALIRQHSLHTNYCLEGVPDEEDGGVVDLPVVVVHDLLLPGHVGPLPGGVSVCLHRQHHAAVGGDALAVEALLPEHDVIVHAAGVVASDALDQIAEPRVSWAGITRQTEYLEIIKCQKPVRIQFVSHGYFSGLCKLHWIVFAVCVCRPGKMCDVQPNFFLQRNSK